MQHRKKASPVAWIQAGIGQWSQEHQVTGPQHVVPLKTLLIAGGALLLVGVGVVVALMLLGGSDSAVPLPARHDMT